MAEITKEIACLIEKQNRLKGTDLEVDDDDDDDVNSIKPIITHQEPVLLRCKYFCNFREMNGMVYL
jgi:hypothetical protein